MLKFFFIFIGVLILNLAKAEAFHEKVTAFNVENILVADALRMLAKIEHQNIIVSPLVQDRISLHLGNTSASEIMQLILRAHNLVKIKNRNTWLILPRAVFLQQTEVEHQLQETLTAISPLQSRTWQIYFANAENVVSIIRDGNSSLLSKRGSIHVDKRTNRLCAQDTDEHLAKIEKVIQSLDIPVRQVLIEVRLVSIDSSFEEELGIDFTLQESGQLSIQPGHYSLALAKLADGSLLDVRLRALEKQGHAEIISRPSLFTSNQQPASIEAGEEIPYQEVSKSGATGVSFKKAVLSLQVTPQVLPGNQILLQLQVNQDKPSSRVVLGVPSIMTRQIKTNVLISNGQTIALGGIFEVDQDTMQQSIPFLGKIPLLGRLFTQQNRLKNKRELVIFVTPKTINTLSKSWQKKPLPRIKIFS